MAVTTTPSEPASFHQVVQFFEWNDAMAREITALELNNTWTLTQLPPSKSPIGCKWVYRIKYHPYATIERYKTRLVVKGFTQKNGLDYSKTFSLVAKSVLVKIVLSLATVKGWFRWMLTMHFSIEIYLKMFTCVSHLVFTTRGRICRFLLLCLLSPFLFSLAEDKYFLFSLLLLLCCCLSFLCFSVFGH